MTPTFSIEPLSPDDFDEFVAYMNEHLAENGTSEAGYFQPLSRSISTFPQEKQAAFRTGLAKPVRESGWRRAWIARSDERRIIGHVDLRGYPDQYTDHRCFLGIGVNALHRRRGIGKALIEYAKQWAQRAEGFEWVDLQVLGNNEAAISLYRKTGFKKVGEVVDLYRIDGESFSYTTMTVSLEEKAGRVI